MEPDEVIPTGDEFGDEFDGEFSISIDKIRSTMLMFGFDVNDDGVFVDFETGDVLRSRSGEPVSPDDRIVYLDSDSTEPHGFSMVPVLYDEASDEELAEWGWDDVDADNPAVWGNYKDASWDEMKESIGYEFRFDDDEWDDPRDENDA